MQLTVSGKVDAIKPVETDISQRGHYKADKDFAPF